MKPRQFTRARSRVIGSTTLREAGLRVGPYGVHTCTVASHGPYPGPSRPIALYSSTVEIGILAEEPRKRPVRWIVPGLLFRRLLSGIRTDDSGWLKVSAPESGGVFLVAAEPVTSNRECDTACGRFRVLVAPAEVLAKPGK
jgi:hypothetical protein